MLDVMRCRVYLSSREELKGRSARRLYRAAPLGCEALNEAKQKVREIFKEMLPSSQPKRRAYEPK